MKNLTITFCLLGLLWLPYLSKAQHSSSSSNYIIVVYNQPQSGIIQMRSSNQPINAEYRSNYQAYPQRQQIIDAPSNYRQYNEGYANQSQSKISNYQDRGQKFRNTVSDISQVVGTLSQIVQLYQQIKPPVNYQRQEQTQQYSSYQNY